MLKNALFLYIYNNEMLFNTSLFTFYYAIMLCDNASEQNGIV